MLNNSFNVCQKPKNRTRGIFPLFCCVIQVIQYQQNYTGDLYNLLRKTDIPFHFKADCPRLIDFRIHVLFIAARQKSMDFEVVTDMLVSMNVTMGIFRIGFQMICGGYHLELHL